MPKRQKPITNGRGAFGWIHPRLRRRLEYSAGRWDVSKSWIVHAALADFLGVDVAEDPRPPRQKPKK